MTDSPARSGVLPWLAWTGAAALVMAAAVGVTSWSSPLREETVAHAAPRLAPTAHPPVPKDAADAWLVPTIEARARFAQHPGVRALRDASNAMRANRFADASAALTRASLSGTPLEPYAEYYRALADLRQRRPAPARERFSALRRSLSAGRLRQLTLTAEADAALALGDAAGAAALLEELYPSLTVNRDVVLDQWATAARAAGRPDEAVRLWLRLYYEFPTSELAPSALRQAETTKSTALVGTVDTLPRDLVRAEALLEAGRLADAAAALTALDQLLASAPASPDIRARRDRIQLLRAQAACRGKGCGAALASITDLVTRQVAPGEAQYLQAKALRELGRVEEYRQAIDTLAGMAPGGAHDVWVERALDEYGTWLIRRGADEDAAQTFRRLFDRNPGGRYAERAAWKYGWWSYRRDRFDEAARVFELAAASIPRANTRPAWLYWAGRAREHLGETGVARERLTLAAIDYLHSYYGRLAADALTRLGAPIPTTASAPVGEAAATQVASVSSADTASDLPNAADAAGGPNDPSQDAARTARADAAPPADSDLMAWLVSAEMYPEAIDELKHHQRVHGRTPAVDATLAWVYRQQRENRPAINVMRQAYPQYLSVQGTELPRPIQEVIFPIDYVPLIKRYARDRGLDPFIVAALIGQESSYVPDVRSPANAWGLMQILPSTGAMLARAEGVRPFRTQLLTDPETNVRLGTRHVARLIRQLGGVPYALAGYNAGEARVIRWRAERGPIEDAEFIDDIPFPETQIYVKKIMGTAVDYQRLYKDLLE